MSLATHFPSGLLSYRRGVEGGGVIVLLAQRVGINSARVIVGSRSDTTTAEAEGMPPLPQQYLASVF
jgi:hypothetical protein